MDTPELNTVETVETVEVENTTETPVVSDSMKASTAFGLGALAMGLIGGVIQGGIWLGKKIVKVKRWVGRNASKNEPKADADPKQPIDETNEFPEFDDPE